MSGLPLTRKMSYNIAAPPSAPIGRQALLVQEGWSLSPPSSFGHQPTMHNAIAASIGTRARDLAKLTRTSQGLTAWGTNPLNVHGAVNAQTPVHKPWHTGQQQHHPELEDWRQRAGYGVSPRYLQRQRSVFGNTVASEISASSGRHSARLTSSKASLSPFEKPALAYSEGTIRLLAHPIQWQRPIQQQQWSASHHDSLTRNASPMCCTYGLHPAFPR